jgi:hypothetical protein
MENKDNEKRVLDAEIEQALKECLPFEEGEYAEVTFPVYSKLPEEVKPYYYLCPPTPEQRIQVQKEIAETKTVSLATMTEMLSAGMLSGWRNHRTRTRPAIAFTSDEVKNLVPEWREAMFWKAFGFNNPNAQEREGLG